MADLLLSLAQGLKSAGGTLSPQVYQGNENEQLQQSSQRQQVQNMMLQQALQQATPQAQAQRQALQNEQGYREAMSQLPPDAPPEAQAAIAMKFGKPEIAAQFAQARESRQAREQQFTLAMEQKRAELAAKLQEAQANRASREDLARIAQEGRADMIRLAASLRAPQQPRQLQLTADAEGNQLIVNPDGTTTPLTTQNGAGVRKPVAADKPMTEFQGKSALYGTRAAQSDKVLQALENEVSTIGLAAGQKAGTLGNFAMSSEQRRVTQAQRDFVNAVLRQESGAVISDAEFANAKKQYFPQPGDDKDTIAQKRANRELAINGFARMSGPKGDAEIKAIRENPLLPGQPAGDGWSVKEKK